MKTLQQYINEAGHYETREFIDPDTAEVVQVTTWIEDPDPTKELEKLEKAKDDAKRYEQARKRQEEYYKKINPLEDELWGYENELKETIRNIRTTKTDMEEEVGQYYSKGDYEGGDKASQKYGVILNKLDDTVQKLKKKINNVQSRIDALHTQYGDIWNF